MKKSFTPWLKDAYRIGLFIKGLDGSLEMAGGFFLLVIPQATLRGVLSNWASAELVDDPHSIIATWVNHLDQKLTHGVALFAALYLLLHGLIKLALAISLIKEKRWAFPPAIVVLLAFITYQSYLVGHNHSTALAALTTLDVIILGLVIWDWRRLIRTSYTKP